MSVEVPNGETGYQKRDQRCEGMYVGLQSTPLNVQVVSLVKGGLNYDLSRDRMLYIGAPRLADVSDPIVIQGRAREANVNWALDASLPGGDRLRWNLADVIVREQLASDRVGVFGYTSTAAGRFQDRLFVPLHVSPYPSGSALPSAPIELVIKISGASAVRWSLEPGQNAATAERLNVDGYFRIMLPAGIDGATPIHVYWRPRGQPTFNPAPERLVIAAW